MPHAATLLAEAAPAPARRARPRSAWVRAWIWGLVVLVLAMVAIGGATRLTGSGLSITEWKPVTGAVPPLSEPAWRAEFEKYRASSQYQNLNRGMEMPEFRRIYWWEWSHRQLGRLIGVIFLLPLLGFWFAGWIGGGLA
ncbi:COX15/CtaA family protein, partial [Enterovirga sp.]|uniref:COX15/CtaA family protein n=1 Tax=Enterovirga sp. TaxID=2026350 RepID=UPI00261ABB42